MGFVYDYLENCFVRDGTPSEGIPQLMWHITNRCKLNCKFCFSKKNTDEIVINDLSQYIQKFCALRVQKIDLSGGEPLLHENLTKICEALLDAGIHMTITTRAAGLDSNKKWLLDNWEKFARVIVSVDVPYEQPFTELAGNQNVWNETIELLQSLGEKQCTNLRINTVVSSYLLNDLYLAGLAEIVERCYCREWCLIEPHPANKKATFKEVEIQHGQFEDTIRKVEKILKDRNECRLLVREQKNYADYWVLYPDGILAKHTDGEQDIGGLPFLETDAADVIVRIKDKIWVPEGKNEV